MRGADDPGQAGVAAGVARQREQVPAGRIGFADPRGDHAFGLRRGNRYVQ
jgi:hypothetical protein